MGDGNVKSRQSFSRNRRLEGEMRAVLAELLRLSVKDPRLEGVTVSAIQLSADRTQARVFYSVIGDDERERQAADGFAAAAAFLRRELGQRMRLRTVPALEFHRDTSYEYGDRIERLLDRIQGGAPAADDADDADDDAGTEEP
jgi:ribosome-binding factor A